MIIKNIFFDFDGVIAESVSAKTDAFKEMYLPYGEKIADQVVEYHINHGGVSRYEKFRYWEKTFFDKDITEQKVQELAQEFSNLVLDKVIHSDEVPGAKAFIEKYSQSLNFWVITGTPTTEIEIITKERKLTEYFIGIHGSPKNKRYWTEYLLKQHDLKRNETLFLGDATTDQDAADFSKLHFALRENSENKEIFQNYDGMRFKDFSELELIINEHI
ncbi:HAD hydrolase-like protein [uncultured Aquimarina sp.]|uniref:HAD family hydrolase n=1 Tax=uncultured Aquimarina sp. TaxID=575652 RepID=UPI00262AD571|nr:HAD hydrolase-like protein [uncultured Aquimarina sp.]